jgi:hypothetical protein
MDHVEVIAKLKQYRKECCLAQDPNFDIDDHEWREAAEQLGLFYCLNAVRDEWVFSDLAIWICDRCGVRGNHPEKWAARVKYRA